MLPIKEQRKLKLKRKSKPKSYSDLIFDVPDVLKSENTQYSRMQVIGSVSDVIIPANN